MRNQGHRQGQLLAQGHTALAELCEHRHTGTRVLLRETRFRTQRGDQNSPSSTAGNLYLLSELYWDLSQGSFDYCIIKEHSLNLSKFK